MSTRSRCALFLLCLVQGCERFAFFAMLPLFVLYLQQRHGFTEQGAMLLLGVFSALSYLGALPGGMLADRRLGRVGAALLGCALLTLGYGALALDRSVLLWPALGLMVAGHGFFKPSVSALAGRLFQTDAARRDRGFVLVHFAVNVGAMVGPLCGEWSRTRSGWAGIFVWAAAGTFVAAFILAMAWRLYDEPSSQIHLGATESLPRHAQRKQWYAVQMLCGVAIVLYLTAQQAGSSLALFAEFHTERSVAILGRTLPLGPGPFASLHSLLVLALLPPLLIAMAWLRRRAAEPSTRARMILGFLSTAAAFALLTAAGLHGGDTGRVSPVWLAGCYALLSLGELLLAPLGISLVIQFAPSQKISQAVGLWFTATALGNVLAGAYGLLWGRWPNHCYFGLVALLATAAISLVSRKAAF